MYQWRRSAAGFRAKFGPDHRNLVQAWRRDDFPEGVYSMAAITLAPTSGGGTELVLTHRGVPKHLIPETEDYWRRMYWERLKQLATSTRHD